MNDIHTILRDARVAAGLRIGVAAERIGIHRVTLYRYEHGIGAPPSTPVRRSILAAYGQRDPGDSSPDCDGGGE